LSHPITQLNKAFESRIRLGIMSVLAVNEQMDFNALKKLLALTDGNLSSHITALEELGFVAVTKEFVGRKPKTSYAVTENGRVEFVAHINALENLIKISH
jgi:DNA-binding HxlR family transcriptional regulator